MKVSEYNLALQSSHERSQQSSVKETLRVWVDRAASAVQAGSERVTISDTARQKQVEDAAAASDSAADPSNDPKLRMLVFLIEKLTGLKVRVFDGRELKASADSEGPQAPPADARSGTPARAGFGVAYDRIESYSESEQTTFEASGVIRTSDGKEISFSLNLAMQRQYSETSTTSIRMGDAARKTDPLVINFNGTAAQLGEQRFAFDLNADGADEQINFVGAGSGFLALDLNGDGKVNDGKELLGTATGNGFNELGRYDADGNGWPSGSGAFGARLDRSRAQPVAGVGLGGCDGDAAAGRWLRRERVGGGECWIDRTLACRCRGRARSLGRGGIHAVDGRRTNRICAPRRHAGLRIAGGCRTAADRAAVAVDARRSATGGEEPAGASLADVGSEQLRKGLRCLSG